MSSFFSKFISNVSSYFHWPFRSTKRSRDENSDLDDSTEIGVTPSKRLKLQNSFSSKSPRDNGQTTVRLASSNSKAKLRLTEDLFQPASYKSLKNSMPINWNKLQDDDGKPPKHVSSPVKSRNHNMAALSRSTIDLTKDDIEENNQPRISYVDLTRPPRKVPRKSLPLSSSGTSYVDLTDQDNNFSPPVKKNGHNNIPDGGDSNGNGRQKGHFFSSKSSGPRERKLSLSSQFNRNSFDSTSKSTKSVVSIDLTSNGRRKKKGDRSSNSSVSAIDLQEWNNYGKVLGSMLNGSVNLVSPPRSPVVSGSIDLTEDDDIVEQSNKTNHSIQRVKSAGSLYVQKPNEPSTALDSATRNGVKREIMRVNSLQDKISETPYAQEGWVQKIVKEYYDKCDEFKATRDHFIKEAQKWDTAVQGDIEAILEEKLNRHLKITDACLPEIIEELKSVIVPIPELTSEMERKVRSAYVSKSSNPLITKFGLPITQKDISTFRGLTWLNDEVINFYMELINQRCKDNDNYPAVFALSTFFYAGLFTRTYSMMKRWTRKINMFELDMIIIPIHLTLHWCLAVVDIKKKRINYYDSMGRDNNECLARIANYVKCEHKARIGEELDMENWVLDNVKDIPQQMNGSDCGVFACTYAEFSARRAPFTFDQSRMSFIRKKMAYEILIGKLIQ